ncbi:hypothetical protein QJS04_geneDACA007192 [Acorus gramineus]|uniref:Pectinesterase inhibitor domain-containing protein n=1 Tax=Acorus gramineus TaxID=55184 RepID=A0AAV9BSJ6_ACOGR|nr:hypothetical protein QJS04_geneDACA007192 [Acorus gramineus]
MTTPPPTLTLLLLLCLSISAATATDDNLIKDTCAKTQYPKTCVSALSSYPNGSATDVAGLASIALSIAADDAAATSTHISQLLQSTSTTADPAIEQALQDCSDEYGDAVDQLEDSLAALDSDAYGDVNAWVAAAMTDADTCEQAFADAGKTSVLGDRSEGFKELCSIALSIVKLLG